MCYRLTHDSFKASLVLCMCLSGGCGDTEIQYPKELPEGFYNVSQPMPGIQVLDAMTSSLGVDTLEGEIAPLMTGFGGHVLSIDLFPGIYTHEHPHRSESFIYTVSGKWVLVSSGKRILMKPGSLFWFGPGVSTGYEVPFEEPALTLHIIVSKPSPPQDFLHYLQQTLKPELEEEHSKGEPFFLSELDPNDPGRVFARQVNPDGGW